MTADEKIQRRALIVSRVRALRRRVRRATAREAEPSPIVVASEALPTDDEAARREVLKAVDAILNASD